MKHFISFLIIICFMSCEENDAGESMRVSPPPSAVEINDSIPIDIPELHHIDLDHDTVTFLALGDSYTIGTGVQESDRWPNQLVDKLRMLDIKIEDPEIVARAGWRTDNLIKAMEDRKHYSEHDVVSLLIGVNNQYSGGIFEVFQQEFIQLLTISLEMAKSRSSVIVLSIPDYGATPFGANNKELIGKEIDMYNEWIQDVCLVNHIKFYHITEISRKAQNDLSLLADDLLHPSPIMYSQWVNEIISGLPEILIR